MMYTIVLFIHILVCLFLIVVVLLQSGKGGGMASTFGGSGTSMDSYFGGRGASTFLNKLTGALAIIFMALCIVLSFLVRRNTGPASLMEEMVKSGGGQAVTPFSTSESPQPVPGGAAPPQAAPQSGSQSAQPKDQSSEPPLIDFGQ